MSEAILQALTDRQRLEETILAFGTAVDTLDLDLYRSIFAEEANFDAPALGSLPATSVTGVQVDDWATGIEGFLRGFDATQHRLSNFTFDINGDSATVTAYVIAEHFLVTGSGDGSVTLGGRYTFGLHRFGDTWKISDFRLEAWWHRGNPGLYELAATSGGARRPVT